MNKVSTLWGRYFGPEGNGPSARCVFYAAWVLLICLYWPARNAGFVTDFTGWLDQVRHHSFRDFINRTHFQAQSWYQLTQFVTWMSYKLFGVHPLFWHIFFVTLHALNARLLYTLCRDLLTDAGARNGGAIAAGAALLFCIAPYASEVIVWEPAFHFLQGLLLILGILICVLRFIHTGDYRLAVLAVLVYLVSLFSLEVFYLTPWLVLSLGWFYKQLAAGKDRFKPVLLQVFIPMLLLLLLRIVGYRVASGDWVSRIGTGQVASVQWAAFGKPAKYLFHLLLLGRFWPQDLRQQAYAICDSPWAIAVFFGICFVAFSGFIRASAGKTAKAGVARLLFIWMILALLLLVPLWFASDMLVVYDRYIYFAGAFFYAWAAVVLSQQDSKLLRGSLFLLLVAANLRFEIQVIRYWAKSSRIVINLLNTIPDDRNKTMLLLNIPQCMHGVPMIGAEKNSEYKLMHDLLIPGKLLTNTVYDVMAYNMLTPQDGAHVHVINDSLVKVTLNQWGTWWWLETRGGYSYWTTDFKLDLRDPGHWYELTLRKPADQYILLYNVGNEWKRVDMSKKGIEQD